jgi:hypothetical protein
MNISMARVTRGTKDRRDLGCRPDDHDWRYLCGAEAYAVLVGMGAKLDADLLRAFSSIVLTCPR